MRATRTLFLLFLGSVLLSLTAGVILIRTVDPERHWTAGKSDRYERFRPMDIAALNKYRFGLIEKAKPTTLLLGNSRTLYGFARVNFDPHTFNAAMDAAQMDLQEEYAQFTIDRFPLKRIVIGTDFGMFIGHSQTTVEPSASCYYITSLCNYLSTYSPMAFKGSLQTLNNFRRGINDDRDHIPADGFAPVWPSNAEQPLRVRHTYAMRIMRYAFAEGGDYERTRMRIRQQSKPQYQALRRVLEKACGTDAQIQLVILPLHQDALVQFTKSGLMPEFQSFKKKIVESASLCKRIEVWDFDKASPYTSEPITADTKEWKWFIEPFHFRPALGVVIADVLAGRRPAKGIAVRLDVNQSQ